MSEFPKLTKAQRHGLLGMAILETFVVGTASFVVRETEQKIDVGIDGYIDILEKDDAATGRCVAFQLKCGPSYLSTQEKAGFIYYGENRHLNLFMNHPVPVILIVVDPGSKRLWWVAFDFSKTDGVKNGWRILIPFANECGPDTAASWKAIAGVHTNFLDAASKEWSLKKKIKESDRLFVRIPRPHIEQMRFDVIVETFARLTSSQEMILRKQNSVDFGVAGYDKDPREVWEIPEICRWWQFAESVGKYWFYFCSYDHPASSIGAQFYCTAGVTLAPPLPGEYERQVIIDPANTNAFLERHYGWLNEFTEQHQIPIIVNYQISVGIAEFLQIVPRDRIMFEGMPLSAHKTQRTKR